MNVKLSNHECWGITSEDCGDEGLDDEGLDSGVL